MLASYDEAEAGGGAAKRGEDGARQGHADALPNYAARGQKAGGHPLLAGGRVAHQRAVVRRLEERLPHANEDQPPDDIPDGALRVELAQQDQPDTTDAESHCRQPARADAVREAAADGRDAGNGDRQRREQQAGLRRGEGMELLQVEGQQEAHREERHEAQDQADVRRKEDPPAQQSEVDDRVGDAMLDDVERDQGADAHTQAGHDQRRGPAQFLSKGETKRDARQPDRQQDGSQRVKPAGPLVDLLFQEIPGGEEAQDADRDVDVKYPAPGEV